MSISQVQIGRALADAQRRAADDLTPLHALMHRLGLFQRAKLGDERPDLSARNDVAGLEDFGCA